jgi:hypothetical protein
MLLVLPLKSCVAYMYSYVWGSLPMYCIYTPSILKKTDV